MKNSLRSIALLCLIASAPACVPAIAGAGLGGATGYAVTDDDDKKLGVGLGAAFGLLVGSVFWIAACFEAPYGAHWGGGSSSTSSPEPWYCKGI